MTKSKGRFAVLFTTHVLWITVVCLLGGWWARVMLKQAERLVELERAAGVPEALLHLEKTQRMIFWEGGTFFALILGSGLFLLWYTWRDALRTRSLQAFFASVTHELRTPLTSIRLQSESIAETLSSDDSRKDLVTRLLEDTTRLESQVERTLELARMEGGGGVSTQPLNIRSWLDRALRNWKESYAGRIEFQLDVTDLMVEADPSALQVILRNLLDNSLKHSRRQPVRVRISAESAKDGVFIVFQDDGDGFKGDGETLGKLFAKGPSSQGTGVGLYLIKVLMTRMGGWANFATGRGFRVALCFKEAKHG